MRARRLHWQSLWLAAACSSSPAPPPEPVAAPAAAPPAPDPAIPALPRPDFLEFIPAETPYLFTALSPPPAGYIEREYLSRLASYEKVRPAIERLRRKRPKEMKRLSFLVRMQVALLAELDGEATGEKLAGIGLDPSTVGALYGLGMNPVLRIRLSDPERFTAALGRIAARLEPIERAALDGRPYFVAREDAMLWIFAVAGSDLVVALIPPAQRAAALPLLLGQRVPARSLADDRRLDQLAAEYGLSPAGLGYADLTAMAVSLGAALPEPCAGELDELAAAVPRVAAGLIAASGEQVRVRSVVELRSDVAGAFMAMRGEVPIADPATSPDAPFELAAAVDMSALVTWLGGALERVAARPYACSTLAWLNDMARTQGPTLRQAGHALAGVRGASVAVRNLEGLVTADADFFFLFGSDRPGELLGRLAGVLGAARPALDPGDPPVELVSPLGGVFGKLHVALGRRAVGISVGGEASELADLISAGVMDDPPLFLMRLDPQQVGQVLRMGGTGHDPRIAAVDRELARNLAEMELVELERFDQVSVTARATPRGIEVELDGRYPR